MLACFEVFIKNIFFIALIVISRLDVSFRMHVLLFFLSLIMVPMHCFDSTYPKSSIYLKEFWIVPILTPRRYAKSGLEGKRQLGFTFTSLSIQFIIHLAIAMAFDSEIFFKSGRSISISLTFICFKLDFCGSTYLTSFIHTPLLPIIHYL